MTLRTGALMIKLFKRSAKWKNLDNVNLAKLKQVLLMISDDIMNVCNKYDLKCIMAYGTALGAIRHKGFIPWDDDMDFYMSRQDYMKFLKVCEHEMGDKYIIRSVSKGDKFNIPTCHVRLKETYYVNYGDVVLTANEPEEDRGIYVDIFPLDDASDHILLRNIRGIRCLWLQFIASCINVKDSVEFLTKEKVKISNVEKKQLSLKLNLGKFFSYKSLDEWVKRYDKVASMVCNPKSKFITCYTGYKSLKKSTFLRSDIYPCKIAEFEGRKWNVPHNFDIYLRQEYGDYMVIPKLEYRKIHPIFELDFGKYI